MKKYYNIHNLLTFSIEGDEKRIEHLCKQCEYFLVDRIDNEEDIKIYIGQFKNITETSAEYVCVNRKYCVGENVVYAEDMYKTASWKMQIEGLDAKQTKFYFDGNGWTKYILHKSFVEALIRYKLNAKGYFMVHSSSVSINGKGVIFPASPEAGKTSTMLNYLNMNQKFMSDDFSLFGNGMAYAYPTPITLHSHNLKRHTFLGDILSAKEKREIWWRTLVLKLTFGLGDISYKVDIWTKKGMEVAASVPLAGCFFLTKYSGNVVKVKEITKKEMVEKLMVVNYYETVLFEGYLKAYYYKNFPSRNEEFWNKMRENIAQNLNEESYYEIYLPKRYSINEFMEVKNLLEKLI